MFAVFYFGINETKITSNFFFLFQWTLDLHMQ